MELALNLFWALLAALMLCRWAQFAPGSGSTRHRQAVALAMLVVLLFPVISVTDDLQTTQSPAEAECCIRRIEAATPAPSLLSSLDALPPAECPAVPSRNLGSAFMTLIPVHGFGDSSLHPIQNRPPPAT